LRERREDIPLLVNHFVSKFAKRMGKEIRSFSRNVLEILTNAPWRGNVRELANFMERCVILTQGSQLNVPHTDLNILGGRSVMVPIASSFREAERRVIIDALNDASGKIAGKGGAAERLGLKRTTLQNKIRRLSIRRTDYSDNQYTNRERSC
jgi:formate hydrogenlyase transcriptional activator